MKWIAGAFMLIVGMTAAPAQVGNLFSGTSLPVGDQLVTGGNDPLTTGGGDPLVTQ